MNRVGVAELKASLSSYLARVKAGEAVVVTEHGRPVARLVPIAAEDDIADAHLATLERAGLLRRGSGPVDLAILELARPEDPAGQSRAFLLDDRDTGR